MTEPTAYRIGLEGQTPLLWGRFFRPLPGPEHRQKDHIVGQILLWPGQETFRAARTLPLVPLAPEEEAALNYVGLLVSRATHPYLALAGKGQTFHKTFWVHMDHFRNHLGVPVELSWLLACGSADDLISGINALRQTTSNKKSLTALEDAELRLRWDALVQLAETLRLQENEVFGPSPFNSEEEKP